MLIPTVTIDSSSVKEDVLQIAKQLSICGVLIVEDKNEKVNLELICAIIRAVPCPVKVKARFSAPEEIVQVFDQGAFEAIVKLSLNLLDTLPKDRIILECDNLDELNNNNVLYNEYSSILIAAQSESILSSANNENKNLWSEDTRLIIVDDCDIESLTKLDKLFVDVQGSKNHCLDGISLGEAIAAPLVSDRMDGLFTTLVVDEHSTALGLCYSNKESICEAVKLKRGVYHSRKRGLWYKGDTSGATQDLLYVSYDCDRDCLVFVVHQNGKGFCHQNNRSCFGKKHGFNLSSVVRTLENRKLNPIEKSYTNRLLNDTDLLHKKIREEAAELCESKSPDEVAWETADLLYFALVKCVTEGVSLKDVEDHLNFRSNKITRRPGNAKPEGHPHNPSMPPPKREKKDEEETEVEDEKPTMNVDDKLENGSTPHKPLLAHYKDVSKSDIVKLIQRPAVLNSDVLEKRCTDILSNVKQNGDKAVLEYTSRFDKVDLESPILDLSKEKMPELDLEVRDAIELAFNNIYKFHEQQLPKTTMHCETMPGVNCSRFVRPIERVGLYVPGGTAVLPSTTLMLGVPAMVAGCEEIVIATPPRKDGTVAPEIIYIAKKINAKMILKAGGAQAIGALAYGTATVPKCDKICGPGNSYVTAAKMIVQNDSSCLVSIDMPAGPSEVLVLCDNTADPEFVAIDLLSQAEHGVDSQVVLLTINMNDDEVGKIESEIERLVKELPREAIAREALSKSFCVRVKTTEEAMDVSNAYGPEHLIVNIADHSQVVSLVKNAGSVFLGPYSPESCGDYASGTNHTLPTYGYAKMYSGVNTSTFLKHITAQELTEEGIKNIGPAVACLAKLEGLDAHRNAVLVRLAKL